MFVAIALVVAMLGGFGYAAYRLIRAADARPDRGDRTGPDMGDLSVADFG